MEIQAILRHKFYLIFELEIQIWPEVTMQCTKIKTHTDACYLCKINKTDHFSPILVTSIHKTVFFLIIEIYMGFPYIPEAVSIFCQSVNKHVNFSHIEVTLIIKSNRFVGSSIV